MLFIRVDWTTTYAEYLTPGKCKCVTTTLLEILYYSFVFLINSNYSETVTVPKTSTLFNFTVVLIRFAVPDI